MAAMAYGLVFATVFGLSLLLPGYGVFNTLALLLTYPWSVLLIFVGAWSIAHSGYPIEFYFLPGAAINMVALYLLCRLSVQGSKSSANSVD